MFAIHPFPIQMEFLNVDLRYRFGVFLLTLQDVEIRNFKNKMWMVKNYLAKLFCD